MVLGFVYGVIGQFVISPRLSATTPDRFGNIPLFLVASVPTGLILWAGQASAPGFCTCQTCQTFHNPAPLDCAIEQDMMKSGVPGAERICARALPPRALTVRTALD
jgi:hypothetical protein